MSTEYINCKNLVITNNSGSDTIKIKAGPGETLDIDSTITAAPAGFDTYVQFNDSGNMAGQSDFVFDKTQALISVGGTVFGTNVDIQDPAIRLAGGIGMHYDTVTQGLVLSKNQTLMMELDTDKVDVEPVFSVNNTTEAANGGATAALKVAGGLTVAKKINLTSNSLINYAASSNPDFSIDAQEYGWIDVPAPLQTRTSGPSVPPYNVWNGGNMRAYEFDSAATHDVFYEIHIPHNIRPGSGIFFHAHCLTNNTSLTGQFVLNFEYTYAKSDAVFPATSTVQAIGTFSNQYQHRIIETAEVAIDTEIDAVVCVRMYRDPSLVTDTANYSVFVLFCDAHVRVSKNSSKFRNKATGSFYV